MQLIFERGDHDRPVGHALIYFRTTNGTIVATYVNVPPIRFDISKFVPGFLAGALQGMDLSEGMVATPIPPIAEQVDSVDYLHAIAERRHDDLVFAGAAMADDPMHLAAETAEAAQSYGQLYSSSIDTSTPPPAPIESQPTSRVDGMSEEERLRELTSLVGRLRESVRAGAPDPVVEQEMNELAASLPAKYRADRLVAAARAPGDKSERLAALYIERSYKLFHEEYLDLERLDREIEAITE
ncbi:MAG TPA: hypothetical protein VFB58_00910 [Chloroflexota bacterium]|nr:hypothetical protein [Chloroflexota bacterium]